MYPEVRVYRDPLEGLTVQLTELRGLIKLVPPLIDMDRQRRWEEISARPAGEDDDDVIDVYETEAGAEEGWGHARFDRTIYVAAIITAGAVFQDYLARELIENYLSYDLSKQPALAKLVEEEARTWDRRFEKIESRYRDFAGMSLAKWPSWEQVDHARELRNALVHNQSLYTRAYLKTKLAYRPTKSDLHGIAPPSADAQLIDHEAIPLSLDMVDGVILQLLAAAAEVREALEKERRAARATPE